MIPICSLPDPHLNKQNIISTWSLYLENDQLDGVMHSNFYGIKLQFYYCLVKDVATCPVSDRVLTTQSEKYLRRYGGFDYNYVRHYQRHYSRCFPFGNYAYSWKWQGSTVMYVWDS